MNANEHHRFSDLLRVVDGLPAADLIDEARCCIRSALGERDAETRADLLRAALACVERAGAVDAVDGVGPWRSGRLARPASKGRARWEVGDSG